MPCGHMPNSLCNFSCSLLDCLAGRIATRQLEGDILINGNPQPGDFKVMSGYVIQVIIQYTKY